MPATNSVYRIEPENIPEQLKQADQWLCWRGAWDEEKEKLNKVPKMADGTAGSSTNAAAWTTFEAALGAVGDKGLDGIGFAGMERTPFVGIDVDNCIDPETGEISPYAMKLVRDFDSYTERTVSGTGLRIWVEAEKAPGSWCGSKNEARELEVYSQGRFFTVTGLHLDGTPRTIERRQEALDAFMEREAPAEKPKPDKAAYNGSSEYRLDLNEFLQEHGVTVLGPRNDQSSERAYAIVCPWSREHTGGDTSGTRVGQFPGGALWFKCDHAHCDGRVWEHFRQELDPGAYKRGRITFKNSGTRTDKTAEASPAKKRNQADRLIDYALDTRAELFVDQMGAPHVLVDGEAVPLNTRSYNWLRGLMWETEEISTGGEALKTAAGTLAAFAVKSGKVRELHTRAAFYEGAVYYQLGAGRVVKIGRDGWGPDEANNVVFRSIPNLKPLPNPERGGSLDALERLVNLKTERDKRMFKVYAATLPLPHIPRPILQTTGVMGSGKTTAGRVVKRLLDPTSPETVRMDPRDFLQKASHSYIVMLDNLNSLPEWGVDTLCRLVTGEADSKRSLYTDDEDFIYEMKRAVLLNGINAPTERGDAQDRTLPVELDRIPDNRRRSEEGLWAAFGKDHGKLLGAIFDALSATLREREYLQLSRRPRLADWGEYAAAAYKALGWGEELFLEDWDAVVKIQNQGTLDGSSVAQAVLSFMESRNEWAGLANDLHAKLEVEAEELNIDTKKDKMWPKAPSWLWRRMREVLPLLTAMGIEAAQKHGDTGSRIMLTKAGRSPDPDPDGNPDSTEKDAVRDAVREKPAQVSVIDGTDGTDSICGHSSTPLSRTREKVSVKAGKNGVKTHTGRELPKNAVSVVSTPEGPPNDPLAALLEDPPEWLTAQLGKCRENERFVKPTCSSVAYEVFQTASRWAEVEPHLRRWLEGGRV